jgi:hypothetical protein
MPTAHMRTSSDAAGQQRIRRRFKSGRSPITNKGVVAMEMDGKRAVIHVRKVWMSVHTIHGS